MKTMNQKRNIKGRLTRGVKIANSFILQILEVNGGINFRSPAQTLQISTNMQKLFVISLGVLLLAYYLLYPSSKVNDDEVQIKISDRGMTDLCESMALLYQNGLFSDLTIVVEDEFKVHKSILSARSEVFRQMLESQKDLDRISVEGISKSAANQMLFFIYTGHTEELSVESAKELFVAADKYKLHLLKVLCSDIMVKNLNLDNVIQFLSLSSKHADENLKRASVDFIVTNTVEVRRQSKWLEFVETFPKLADDVIGSLASKI